MEAKKSAPGPTIDEIVKMCAPYHCLLNPAVELPALFEAFAATPARRFLELGTYQGATSAAMRLAFPDAEIWTLDLPKPSKARFNPQPRKRTGRAHRDLGIADSIKQLWMNTSDLYKLRDDPEARFDMIFVDADHSEVCCLSDLCHSVPLLTDEGILVAHDYTEGGVDPEPRPHWTVWVEAACRRFLTDKHPDWQSERLPGWLLKLFRPRAEAPASAPTPSHSAASERPATSAPALGDEAAGRVAALGPDGDHAPWRVKALQHDERVLHVHLATPQEPQESLCRAVAKLGREQRVDWPMVIERGTHLGGPLRDAMFTVAQELQPTVVFMQLQRPAIVEPDTLVKLRKLCGPRAVMVHWSGDITEQYGQDHWYGKLATACDLLLFSCNDHAKAHRRDGVGGAGYLQIGYCEERYHAGDDGRYGSTWDVAMLAQRHGSDVTIGLGTDDSQLRDDVGKMLLSRFGARASVMGAGWPAKHVPPARSGDLYRACHMAVSISYANDLDRYSSDRLLRILACGTVAVVKRFPGMASWGLQHEQNCLVFETLDELNAIFDTWLAPERRDALREIGRAGATLAQAHHRWDVRMRELMAYVAAVRGDEVELERPW